MTWMNLFSILLASIQFGGVFDTDPKVTAPEMTVIEIGEDAAPAKISNDKIAREDDMYIIVERLDDEMATLESRSGHFDIPRAMLPRSADYEGAVIAWEHRPEEGSMRIAEGYARIARMQNAGAY